jgi:hypothetical protein
VERGAVTPSGNTAADFGLQAPPAQRVPLDPHELPEALCVGQPGWRLFAGRIRVLLDGVAVERCVGFDCA